jgi:TldD protein
MNNPWTRRDLLHGTATGLAALSMPTFLASCAKQGIQPLASGTETPGNPFQLWFGIDEATIRRVMTELSARGADAADLYFQHTRSNSIRMEDGLISEAAASIDQGVGLRVVVGDQVGYAFTEDLTLESMLGAARTAAAIAQGVAVAPSQTFQYGETGAFYRIAVPWADVGIDQKLPIVEKAAALAKAGDPAIDKVSVSWNDSDERVLIADLRGNVYMDSRPMTRLWVNCTATKGEETQSNRANIAGRHGIDWYTDERLQMVAKQAVDRTMILFDAVRPKAGEMPVVLAAGASGILLHEAIGHGMEADFNRKGTSIYSDMLGKKVAPDFVTIVDDGTQPGERGALNLDDEGTPCEKTVLVENGIMTSYLHDNISAKHYGLERSTGSGRRQSFRHTVMPRMRSTYMLDGPHTRDEIIASVDNGIIAETFTNGQVNIGAGDYTFYIKNGWLIEGGKVTAPLKDVNIIGNGPESLQRVTMAANDFKLDTGGWTCGKNSQWVPVSQGLPTVLVSKMTVGGSDA